MPLTLTPHPRCARWPSVRALTAALAETEGDGHINWGYSRYDKLDTLLHLQDAGILVPELTMDRMNAISLARGGKEVWGRKRNHSKGRDIVTDPGNRFWHERDFWVVKVPNVLHEFRVHVWGGKAFRVGVKVHNEDHPSPAGPIRSSLRGWELKYGAARVLEAAGRPAVLEVLKRTAISSCEALGVSGGALDILMDDQRRFWVLELNTAPSLGEFTLAAWVRRLEEWAGESALQEENVTELEEDEFYEGVENDDGYEEPNNSQPVSQGWPYTPEYRESIATPPPTLYPQSLEPEDGEDFWEAGV